MSQAEENTPVEFIEVRRVISDQEKNNTHSQAEAIRLDDIDSFRAWHKGKNDFYIKGEMTIICFKKKPKKAIEKTAVVSNGKVEEKVREPNEKIRTMLIEESYQSFLNRMSHYVPVRMLPKDSYMI